MWKHEHHTTQREANVKSIDQIPTRLLPADHPARRILVVMAQSGMDVEAYTPFQTCPEEQKRWNVWVLDRRFDVEEWREHFLLAMRGTGALGK